MRILGNTDSGVKKIRAIIVEDETPSALLLEKLIESYCPELEVVASAQSLEEASRIISSERPDVVFLDIELNSENGFELLSGFNDIHCEIIITTAYEKYALKAIKISALDYLLKPIDIEELKEAVYKLKSKFESEEMKGKKPGEDGTKADNIFPKSRLVLSSLKEKHFVFPEEILYLQSERQYTYFNMKDGQMIMTSKNIGEYESKLIPYNFFRCHHSFLINLNEVRGYSSQNGLHAIMTNGSLVDVSKRKKENFMKQFQGLSVSSS